MEIKSLEGKVYEVIDLEEGVDVQVERVLALSRRATAFIFYARSDAHIAETLGAALRAQDFATFVDQTHLRPGDDWTAAISAAIDEAVERGFFLLLLSPAALRSQWVMHEVRYAFHRQAGRGGRSNVIPIVVRDREATLAAIRSGVAGDVPFIGTQVFSPPANCSAEREADRLAQQDPRDGAAHTDRRRGMKLRNPASAPLHPRYLVKERSE